MAALEIFRETLSWHYLAGAGEQFFQVLGQHYDQLHLAAKEALEARFPLRAHPEALPEIGANYNLDWPERFTTQQVRSYISDPWTIWDNAGSKGRMVEEIQRLGYPSVGITTYRDLVDSGLPPATTFGGISSFFFVTVGKPNPWDLPGTWGGGARWGSAPYTWGSTARVQEIDEIRRVIRKWKPAASSCRFILAVLRVNIFGTPTHWISWPTREPWEVRAFYNSTYDKE